MDSSAFSGMGKVLWKVVVFAAVVLVGGGFLVGWLIFG